MVLRLLVDECSEANLLVKNLRDAGHDVLTATEANLRNVRDADVFAVAIADNRILLTNNPADFVALHEERIAQNRAHPGILLVYRRNKPGDMSYHQILKAIANLEKTGTMLETTCHSLVNYNY